METKLLKDLEFSIKLFIFVSTKKKTAMIAYKVYILGTNEVIGYYTNETKADQAVSNNEFAEKQEIYIWND